MVFFSFKFFSIGQPVLTPDSLKTLLQHEVSPKRILDFIEDARSDFSAEDTSAYFQLIQIFVQQDQVNDTVRAHLLFAKATMYYQLSMFPEALSHFNRCLTAYQKVEDQLMEGYCYYFLAWIHHEDYDKLLKYAKQGYEIFKPLPVSNKRCTMVMSLAIAYDLQNESDSALKYYHKYYKEAKSNNAHRSVAWQNWDIL